MPKIVDHDAQRATLLDAAFEIFADQGYAALSMRQLAQGLAVSTGTLYHYFGSKEAIFEQMVGRIAERDVQAAIAAIPEDANRRERLDAIAFWVSAQRANLQRTLLLIFDFQRHRSDDRAVALVQAASQRYRSAIEDQLGDVPSLWPMLLGSVVAGMLDPADNDPAVWHGRFNTLLQPLAS